MSSGIRNSCVARGSVDPRPGPVVYTVPAGNVLLLKDIHFQGISAVVSDLSIVISDPAEAAAVGFPVVTPNTSGQGFWSGWVALNEGDKILVYSTMDKLNFWISGALLPYNAAL